MKVNVRPSYPDVFCILQDANFLENQRYAGKVAAKTISLLTNLIKEKASLTYVEMNDIAEDFILESACQPTFKNYKGFPNAICISINNQLVHGIAQNIYPQEGDVISFDLGTTYHEAIADTATTVIYGEPKSQEHVRLLQTTKECLKKGIDAIKIGNRVGCIGEAIYKHAHNKGYSVVDKYGGHGISISLKNGKGIPHADPFVCNRSSKDEGIHITSGMVIAIEPLLVIGGSNNTKVAHDGWTVITDNISAHEEHTIYIHDDNVEIITQRN
jgi:methionyl aminopeptidase